MAPAQDGGRDLLRIDELRIGDAQSTPMRGFAHLRSVPAGSSAIVLLMSSPWGLRSYRAVRFWAGGGAREVSSIAVASFRAVSRGRRFMSVFTNATQSRCITKQHSCFPVG